MLEEILCCAKIGVALSIIIYIFLNPKDKRDATKRIINPEITEGKLCDTCKNLCYRTNNGWYACDKHEQLIGEKKYYYPPALCMYYEEQLPKGTLCSQCANFKTNCVGDMGFAVCSCSSYKQKYNPIHSNDYNYDEPIYVDGVPLSIKDIKICTDPLTKIR